MSKDNENYHFFLAMSGEIWKNVKLNWISWPLQSYRPCKVRKCPVGGFISTVNLELNATFKLRTSSMLLRGLYCKSVYSLLRAQYARNVTGLSQLRAFRQTPQRRPHDAAAPGQRYCLHHHNHHHRVHHSYLPAVIARLQTDGITRSGAVTVNGHSHPRPQHCRHTYHRLC